MSDVQNVLHVDFMPVKQFTPPQLSEVILHGEKIKLPPLECEKFFYHFDSNGWKVGGKAKMKSWTSAMMSWKLRVQPTKAAPTGANIVVLGREYERVIERMKVLRQTYGDHQTWTNGDKAEFLNLRRRRDELKPILGISI